MIEISSFPCMMHERDGHCGPVWYSATAENHTVGACGKFEQNPNDGLDVRNVGFSPDDLPLTAELVDVDESRHLVLLDAHGTAVTAVAWTAATPTRHRSRAN